MKSLIKNKKLAIIGLIYLVIATFGLYLYRVNFDIANFLVTLNAILLPSWILFLLSLNLKGKRK